MYTKLINIIITGLFITGTANAANQWDSVVNKDYLSDKMGSTVNALTDVENGSRWYTLHRVKSQFAIEDGLVNDVVSLNFRINGNTQLTDDLSIVGNFWIKAIEKNIVEDGFDGFTDNITWEEYRFGVESKDFGAITYSNHVTTWGNFAIDLGMQGLLDSQGDAARKNANKMSYKNHLDNDLFLAGTYDLDSGIIGVDIGYQNMDIYGFAPNVHGIYLSVHNGQPVVTLGSGLIIGNVDFTGDISNSDSGFARADENLLTYSFNGYKNFGLAGRLVAGLAYSPMEDGVTASSLKKQIKQNGIAATTGGLGFSASAGYQVIPQGFDGLSPTFYATYDEFGYSVTPEVSWWFGTPNLRASIAYSHHQDAEDITLAELFWEF